MSKAQELVSFMDRAVLRMPYEMAMGNGLSQHQFYQRVQGLLDRIESASSEQQAAQQDAERWRAFSQGAVFPKLAFNNGNSHWQYGELRGLSANAVADLVIAARASNGGKA